MYSLVDFIKDVIDILLGICRDYILVIILNENNVEMLNFDI